MNIVHKNRMKQIHTESREDYLEALLVLRNQHEHIRSHHLAAHMKYSRASVSHAVMALEQDGLLFVDDRFCLHLTKAGQYIAENAYRKRCYFERYLIQVGVEYHHALKQ